jgi:hypothetical protein
MPGKTNTSRATTICKNFDMSGRESPEKARESIWRTQIPEQRDAGARSKASQLLHRRPGRCSHIRDVRAMKLLLAIVNRLLLDLRVSALPLQRRLADKYRNVLG